MFQREITVSCFLHAREEGRLTDFVLSTAQPLDTTDMSKDPAPAQAAGGSPGEGGATGPTAHTTLPLPLVAARGSTEAPAAPPPPQSPPPALRAPAPGSPANPAPPAPRTAPRLPARSAQLPLPGAMGAPPGYRPSAWVHLLHQLPRADFQLRPVPSGFAPRDQEYQQVGWQTGARYPGNRSLGHSSGILGVGDPACIWRYKSMARGRELIPLGAPPHTSDVRWECRPLSS